MSVFNPYNPYIGYRTLPAAPVGALWGYPSTGYYPQPQAYSPVYASPVAIGAAGDVPPTPAPAPNSIQSMLLKPSPLLGIPWSVLVAGGAAAAYFGSKSDWFGLAKPKGGGSRKSRRLAHRR